MKKYHFVYGKSEWELKEEDKKKATMTFPTKKDGLTEAIKFVKKHGGGLLRIQKQDGKFQEERTYAQGVKKSKS